MSTAHPEIIRYFSFYFMFFIKFKKPEHNRSSLIANFSFYLYYTTIKYKGPTST